jgi:predicted pyridoxine 5'-phosphate oxidase superfamily flavin-nucleotide-binding protein
MGEWLSVRLTEDMQRVVREQSLGFVATVRPDGTPAVSPKGTTSVWDDTHLVFLDLCSPHTIANLASNPNVEVNVVDPFFRKGYRFAGRAEVLTEGAVFEAICERFAAERGTARQRINGAVLIEVTAAEALVSPAYDDGTTETTISKRWADHHRRLYSAWLAAGSSSDDP